MKAAVVPTLGAPLEIRDVPVPTPGPGQVLVRIRAAGVNPVDTYVRSGAYALLPPLPYIPGGDGAGLIEAVGEGVRQF